MSWSTDLVKKYLLGGVNPPGAASSSGDIGQMVKYLAANLGTAPLGFDLFGKTFPYTNGTATDLTINGSDQTVAPTNGVLRYRTITFSTAHTLRITASPCVLMVDMIVWNAAGVLACEASGAPALGADPAENFPRGGRSFSTGDSIGGYGGGFLIVLAGTVNGSTAGTIRANGTAGSSNSTSSGANLARGGEGALSSRMNYSGQGPSTLFTTAEAWLGASNSAPGQSTGPSLASQALACGGDASIAFGLAGHGGGSGGGTASTNAGGGSGFGGGGSASGSSNTAPGSRLVEPSLAQLLDLYRMGCRGGGGGGSLQAISAGANNAAGGGGGGCVCLVVDNETQVSTLTANGGAKAGLAANGQNGGTGYTLRQVV